MWGLYTLLLLLNSSCGPINTSHTRRNRHNQDRGTESQSPCTVSTSEGRASKKAKIVVDNEYLDTDSSDGVEPVDSRLSDGLLGAEPTLPSVMRYHTSKY